MNLFTINLTSLSETPSFRFSLSSLENVHNIFCIFLRYVLAMSRSLSKSFISLFMSSIRPSIFFLSSFGILIPFILSLISASLFTVSSSHKSIWFLSSFKDSLIFGNLMLSEAFSFHSLLLFIISGLCLAKSSYISLFISSQKLPWFTSFCCHLPGFESNENPSNILSLCKVYEVCGGIFEISITKISNLSLGPLEPYVTGKI